MRKLIRSLRNIVYRGFIREMWKNFAFRFFIVEAVTGSDEYDLRFSLGQMERMTVEERDFFRFVINHSDRSYSQNAQDLWGLYESREAKNGFFVEFGATDGIKINNTALMEERYGWNGILAEPNPAWHEALAKNRSAILEKRCVDGATGNVREFFNPENQEYGGLVRDGSRNAGTKLGMLGGIIKVETVSLNDLLQYHEAPAQIDFISIDTEGSEYEILKPTLSNRKISPMVFKVSEKAPVIFAVPEGG